MWRVGSNPRFIYRDETLNDFICICDKEEDAALIVDVVNRSQLQYVPLQAAVPTTREEAAEFFSRYGNVGAPDQLLKEPPSAAQMNEAVRRAILNGQKAQTVEIAKSLIVDPWSG